jgi:hypothetical protein
MTISRIYIPELSYIVVDKVSEPIRYVSLSLSAITGSCCLHRLLCDEISVQVIQHGLLLAPVGH